MQRPEFLSVSSLLAAIECHRTIGFWTTSRLRHPMRRPRRRAATHLPSLTVSTLRRTTTSSRIRNPQRRHLTRTKTAKPKPRQRMARRRKTTRRRKRKRKKRRATRPRTSTAINGWRAARAHGPGALTAAPARPPAPTPSFSAGASTASRATPCRPSTSRPRNGSAFSAAARSRRRWRATP